MCVKIHFTRNSVCMGDDCFNNSGDFEFKKTDLWKRISINQTNNWQLG